MERATYSADKICSEELRTTKVTDIAIKIRKLKCLNGSRVARPKVDDPDSLIKLESLRGANDFGRQISPASHT